MRKHLIRMTLAAVIASFAGAPPASAAILVTTNSGTNLVGINGVFVDGKRYDVRFSGGSCLELYNSCSVFPFSGQAATDAAMAILHNDLINAGGYASLTTVDGYMPMSPLLFQSVVSTPWFACCGEDFADGFGAGSIPLVTYGIGVYDWFEFSNTDNNAYAVWEVPEPITLFLFGGGLGCAIAMGRRKKVASRIKRA